MHLRRLLDSVEDDGLLICAQVARAAGLDLDAVDAVDAHADLGGGVMERVPLRALDPVQGPESGIKGQGVEHGVGTPCNAARSQRNPTIADAIDAEIEFRRQDPKRVASLKNGNIGTRTSGGPRPCP